jgi:hypothetical protein
MGQEAHRGPLFGTDLLIHRGASARETGRTKGMGCSEG